MTPTPVRHRASFFTRFALCALFAAGLDACGGGGGDGAGSSAVATASGGTGTSGTTSAGTSTGITSAAPAAAASDAAGGVDTPTGDTVTAWVVVAMNGDNFTPTGTQTVRYGDGGINWTSKSVSGAATCTAAFFGSDPAPYTQKFCEVQVTAPAVTQVPGARPVVNTALMPAAANPYTTARVRQLTAAELTSSVFQSVASDIGAFREPCTYSHMSFDDPIGYPNQPGASHLHTFAGNSLTNAASTADSLANSGGSTCAGGTLNRTAYWMPSMVDTRTGQALVPSGMNMYYKQGYLGVSAGTMQPFPKGLRILAGDASNTRPAGNVLARFSCLVNGTWQATIPTCALGDSVLVAVTFPQCWDGINLDSPDHRSHMAFATGKGCPADHPVPLPEITLNFLYKVGDADNGDHWRLSSDNYAGAGGLSLHADWYGGWDTPTNQAFLASCDNARMDCHDNLLGDGRILY